MFSKIKGMFSSCRSNHSVALPNETPVTVRNRSNNTENNTHIQKSIFDLENMESHRAIVLDNQKLFHEIQKDTIKIIDDYMKNKFKSYNIKKNLLNKTDTYLLDNFTQTGSKEQMIRVKTSDLMKGLVVQLNTQPENKMPLEIAIDHFPVLQIGTQASNVLHKDNGLREGKNLEFDYTIVVPVVDYDLSNEKNHNFFPQSTQILPMAFKHLVPAHNKKIRNRQTVFYRNIPNDTHTQIKEHLVSEPLKQGTAVILRTATLADSDDDGQSVIHQTPETPKGFVRCFIIERANKAK